jgi:pilus assembly protein CpaB
MNKKALIVLGLALVLGAVTAAAVNRVLKRGSSELAKGEMVRVVVAVSPISVGQRVTPDQVKLEERPKTTLPEGILSDITQVVDRVSLTEVTIGEAILNSRLAPEGSAAGLSAVIPEGMRAMTVKVDEVIGVAGFVAPGTYVDVVATIMRTGVDGDSASRIILQNVKVLASGKQIESGKDGGPVEVKTVTLQVTPEQAEALALASTAGRLQLVMRNTVDENQINTKGIDTVALFQGLIQSAPRTGLVGRAAEPEASPRTKPVRANVPDKEVVPKPAGVTVELIQGAQRSTVTFQ